MAIGGRSSVCVTYFWNDLGRQRGACIFISEDRARCPVVHPAFLPGSSGGLCQRLFWEVSSGDDVFPGGVHPDLSGGDGGAQ
jgi:hypothetical protein